MDIFVGFRYNRTMARILLIEDEAAIRRMLSEILVGAGYDVAELTDFGNLDDLNRGVEGSGADLILLDLGLAGLSGLELLRRLRQNSDIPVIILTGETAEAKELLAMGYGADDFVSKPYKPELLLLRIRAVLRRTLERSYSDIYSFAGAKIDLARGVILHQDHRTHLTKNEMIILRQLLEERGKIVSRETLMTELWNNQEYINDNALTVNVSRLRTKLEKIAGNNVIETRKGLGYSLVEAEHGE